MGFWHIYLGINGGGGTVATGQLLLFLLEDDVLGPDIVKDATNVEAKIRILDSTSGAPETGVTSATTGLALYYRRDGATDTQITPIGDLSALDDAHTDKAILHIGNGYYRVDVPDAAFATGASSVLVHGTATGMVVVGREYPLVDSSSSTATLAKQTEILSALNGITVITVTSNIVAGSSLTIYQDSDVDLNITLGTDLTGWQKLWFTMKKSQDDTDAESYLQIEAESGVGSSLLYINQTAAATATNATLSVTTLATGVINATLQNVESAKIPRGNYWWDCRWMDASGNVKPLTIKAQARVETPIGLATS